MNLYIVQRSIMSKKGKQVLWFMILCARLVFIFMDAVSFPKNENIQSQKSIENIGGKLIGVHNGYHFYSVNIKDKYKLEGRNI